MRRRVCLGDCVGSEQGNQGNPARGIASAGAGATAIAAKQTNCLRPIRSRDFSARAESRAEKYPGPAAAGHSSRTKSRPEAAQPLDYPGGGTPPSDQLTARPAGRRNNYARKDRLVCGPPDGGFSRHLCVVGGWERAAGRLAGPGRGTRRRPERAPRPGTQGRAVSLLLFPSGMAPAGSGGVAGSGRPADQLGCFIRLPIPHSRSGRAAAAPGETDTADNPSDKLAAVGGLKRHGTDQSVPA